MALAALGGIWLLGVAWVFWKLVKGYVVRSPLDNIPGPRPKKYTILGMSHGMLNTARIA